MMLQKMLTRVHYGATIWKKKGYMLPQKVMISMCDS